MFNTVLAIYNAYNSECLPSSEDVLLCSEETTLEMVMYYLSYIWCTKLQEFYRLMRFFFILLGQCHGLKISVKIISTTVNYYLRCHFHY